MSYVWYGKKVVEHPPWELLSLLQVLFSQKIPQQSKLQSGKIAWVIAERTVTARVKVSERPSVHIGLAELHSVEKKELGLNCFMWECIKLEKGRMRAARSKILKKEYCCMWDKHHAALHLTIVVLCREINQILFTSHVIDCSQEDEEQSRQWRRSSLNFFQIPSVTA